MSRSKKEAAEQAAYSDAQAKQWTEESKALLEKFIKANPDRPEAIQEAARWSEERAMEGQYAVLRATYTADKAEKAKLLADARKIFEEIRPQFVKALKASEKLLGSLPPKANQRKREDAVVMVGENRLTVAMVDFYLAQTQEEGPQRTDALTKSIKEFDAIYQDFREALPRDGGPTSGTAGFSRNWARSATPRTSTKKWPPATSATSRRSTTTGRRPEQELCEETGLEGFFADVEQYYLQTLYQLNKKDYLEEVEDLAGRAQGQFRKMLRLPGIDLGICQESAWRSATIQGRSQEKAGQGQGPQAAGRNGQDPQPLPAGRHQAPPPTQPQSHGGRRIRGRRDRRRRGGREEEMGRGHRVLRKGPRRRDPQDRQDSVWPPWRIRSSPATTTWPCSFTRRGRSRMPSPWPRRP